MTKSIIDASKFYEHHKKQEHHRSQKDIFLIWMIIVLVSVIASHFVLNLGGSPTGFVTAIENPADNITLFLGAMLVVFIVIMMVGLIYVGITQRDHEE